jgi:hypothetical protein
MNIKILLEPAGAKAWSLAEAFEIFHVHQCVCVEPLVFVYLQIDRHGGVPHRYVEQDKHL